MRDKQPFSIPFTLLKDKILSKGYDLSLVFVDSYFSRKLNATYRGHDKPANILSFPLTKNSGEIFIDLMVAKKEAPTFEMTFEKFVKYLFIHGCLHLKGMRHGVTMDKAEKKLLHGASNNNRD